MSAIARDIPAAVKAGVDMRDSFSCVKCGVWIRDNGSRHHRQRRQVGGHTFANVVLLCGSGTTGCHGWVHAHPAEARRQGWIVSTAVEDVADVPILIREHPTLAPVYMLLELNEPLRAPIELADAIAALEAVA
jgi:hypothetical protein